MKDLVAGHAFRQIASRSPPCGRRFGHEPALGALRHDDRVLDLLRLGQAENFGTEILAAGPTSASRRARSARNADGRLRTAAR